MSVIFFFFFDWRMKVYHIWLQKNCKIWKKSCKVVRKRLLSLLLNSLNFFTKYEMNERLKYVNAVKWRNNDDLFSTSMCFQCLMNFHSSKKSLKFQWLIIIFNKFLYVNISFKWIVFFFCRTRATITIILIVFFSIVYNFVRFWEFTLDDSGGTSSIEESIVPLLRGDPLFMLLYQNIATLITQFFLPLIVLCFLNLHVSD